MYTLNETSLNDTATLNDTEIRTAFDELVEPIAARVLKPRCADGNGTLTHLFFSDVPLDIARAKAICSKCALAETCRDGAVERAEPWGVWGGELIENGRIVVNKRPRGRPPKHPRPAVVIDEVPLPPHYVRTHQVA
jgi:WhiB family redox-sensing transcriptional regulator